MIKPLLRFLISKNASAATIVMATKNAMLPVIERDIIMPMSIMTMQIRIVTMLFNREFAAFCRRFFGLLMLDFSRDVTNNPTAAASDNIRKLA
jgi:hypothetical protein